MRRTRTLRSPACAAMAIGAALAFAPSALATTPGSLNQLEGPAGCIVAPPPLIPRATQASPADNCANGIGLGPSISDGQVTADDLAGVAASPDGKNVYVANQDLHLDSEFEHGAVAIFSTRDDGSLSQGSGEAACISDQGVEKCAVGRALAGAKDLVVSPDGRNVYVAAAGASAIAVLKRAADGTLSQSPGVDGCVSETGFASDGTEEKTCGVGGPLDGVSDIVISPDGRFVYAVASGANAVTVFRRNDDGRLEQLPGEDGCVDEHDEVCAPGRVLYEPNGLAISPDGSSIYVAVSEGRPFESELGHGPGAIAVFKRDSETGAITQPDDATGCVTDVSAYPNDGPNCTPAMGLEDAMSIEVSPDGRNVYVASQGNTVGALTVFKRAADGSLTQLDALDGCISGDGSDGGHAGGGFRAGQEGDVCARADSFTEPSGLAISADGANVYVTAEDDSTVATFARDAATGILRQLDGTEGCVSDDGTPSGQAEANLCVDGRALEEATRIAIVGCTVYVTARDSGAVDTFRRCTPVSSAAVPGCSPTGAIPVTVTGRPGGAQSKELHFRLDGGAEQVAATPAANPATVTVTVPAGTHALEYWARDEQKLDEPNHHSATVRVGNCTPPGAVLGVTEESPHVCGSRRAIRIRVRKSALRGAVVDSISIRLINPARRFKVTRSHGRYRSVIDLRGLKRSRYTVLITVKLSDGRTLRGKRRYFTCTQARRGGLPQL